jgi:hypothetical protein
VNVELSFWDEFESTARDAEIHQGRLQRWQTAEILGIICGAMRRWKQRCEYHGLARLFRRSRSSTKNPMLASRNKSCGFTASRSNASMSCISLLGCANITASRD